MENFEVGRQPARDCAPAWTAECVLLDEPSEGLAPIIVEQMAKSIRALEEEGLCVLLSEQNLHFSQSVADRACVIERGEIRSAGTVAGLAADPALHQQHLSV